jgi:hypothetical protein
VGAGVAVCGGCSLYYLQTTVGGAEAFEPFFKHFIQVTPCEKREDTHINGTGVYRIRAWHVVIENGY